MKQFWHWLRVVSAAMVTVCLFGILAIWWVPHSVWVYVLPSAFFAEKGTTPSPGPSGVVLLPIVEVAKASALPGLAVDGRLGETPALVPQNAVVAAVVATSTATGVPVARSTPTARSTATSMATKPPSVTATPLSMPTQTPIATPTASPTPAAPPTAVSSPMPTVTPARTRVVPTTPTATPVLGHAMYVCGYERCRDSSLYGALVSEADIEVWAVPDPEDERVHHTAAHHDEVRILDQRRLWDGPGGLWMRLEEGGWLSDFWLTEERCTPVNLAQASFANCLLGEY